jgi:hypothetical protein
MNIYEAIKNELEERGVANDGVWLAYVGYTPDDQDRVISINPSGGFRQETHGGEYVVPTVQIRVRGPRRDFETTHDKFWDVFNALNNVSTIENVYFIHPITSAPNHFMDSNQRHNMTVDFMIRSTTPGPIS